MVTAVLVQPDPLQAGRTQEARSAALEEALQHAGEAAQRKNEFLATLAHELRNQLGPVMSSLEVLKRAPANADLLGRARTMMERQLLHMNRLVDDLLDVSRITHNQLELRTAPVDLGVVLEHAVEASRPAMEAAGHELTITPLPDPVMLEADSVRLTQVFGNLLANACKYTDAGGHIAVAIELQGSDVVVRVTDDGCGIPPSLLATVFDRFVQVDRTAERAQGGLGIGLALARQLVELHGGSLTAHSEGLGLGSEFLVRLPRLSERSLLLAASPALPQRGEASARRILLVDDNRDAVESLAVLLTISGHEVRTAHDGAEAIEQAESYRPDVILLDIGLPKLNGYEVCRIIRAKPWGKAMVVIALTGWGQEDDRRRTAEAGFTAHLVKPVDYANLTGVLARV